jgi:hypothetical protein
MPANVYPIILEVHQIVVQNVLSMLNVQVLMLVSITNVKTHAQDLVVLVLNVELSAIPFLVFALVAILEIHSFNVSYKILDVSVRNSSI